MTAKRKYKEDPDGVALMHLSFPASENKDAITKTMASKKAIKTSAKVLYYKNKPSFDKVGVRIEDVESVLTCNTYVAFIKNPSITPKILASFLRQRGTKLANLYKGLSAEIVEELIPGDFTVEDLLVDTSNPENVLMAKEEAALRSKEIREKLVTRSRDYITKFIDKNRQFLDNARIRPEEITEMVHSNAIEFASLLYRHGDTIKFSDFNKFKKLLSVRMSRFVKDLKTVNG